MPLQKLLFDYPAPKTLKLGLLGDWRLDSGFPGVNEVIYEITSHPDVVEISLDVSRIDNWDSGLISFLVHLIKECERKNIRVIRDELPRQMQELIAFVLRSGEEKIPRKIAHETFFEKVGDTVLRINASTVSVLSFLGELSVSLISFITGKAYFRREDFVTIIQKCGAEALGLVSLISILVGMILAFIGAIQLKLFGAQIFIADIVGIAMVRVMGAVMTGILMAGRTGASFAAELGLMQTNEEIDALKTLGVSPVEFLVMPRVLALIIMMPLLTLYADLMGILGGFLISTVVLGLNPVEYWNHTQSAVKLNYLWVGLIHSFVFAVIIAIAGCLRGMECERSAASLGEATTSAVVTAITYIVVATAIITFICQVLGI